MSKSATVVIGCKMPTGLLLEIGAPGTSGYRKVLLKGANEGALRGDGLFLPATVCGFGRTEVSRAFWEAWCAGEGLVGIPSKDVTRAESLAHMKSERKQQVEEWQANGTVFVADDPDLALAQANEKAGVRTGFEPLDPNKKAGGIEADAEALAQRRRDNFGVAQA